VEFTEAGAKVFRAGNSVCAMELAENGKIKYHNSNGTMIAVHEGAMYLACLKSSDRIKKQKPGVKLINKYSKKGEDGEYTFTYYASCITWVRLTKELFEELSGWIKMDT
jgi:hypothetical protein